MTADKNGPEKNFSALLEHIHADGKKKWPDFSIGDTIKVHYNIIEGEKKRVQIYEGVVISIRGAGISKSIVVRRISHDVGVERIFPYHSPSVGKIEIVRKGIVRRAKLYYLRGKKGKEARIKEAREIHTKKTGSRKTKKQKSTETKADKSGGKKKTQKKTTKVAKKTVSKKSVKTMKKTASKKKITTKKK